MKLKIIILLFILCFSISVFAETSTVDTTEVDVGNAEPTIYWYDCNYLDPAGTPYSFADDGEYWGDIRYDVEVQCDMNILEPNGASDLEYGAIAFADYSAAPYDPINEDPVDTNYSIKYIKDTDSDCTIVDSNTGAAPGPTSIYVTVSCTFDIKHWILPDTDWNVTFFIADAEQDFNDEGTAEFLIVDVKEIGGLDFNAAVGDSTVLDFGTLSAGDVSAGPDGGIDQDVNVFNVGNVLKTFDVNGQSMSCSAGEIDVGQIRYAFKPKPTAPDANYYSSTANLGNSGLVFSSFDQLTTSYATIASSEWGDLEPALRVGNNDTALSKAATMSFMLEILSNTLAAGTCTGEIEFKVN